MDYFRGSVFPVAKVLVDSYRTTSSEIIGSVVLYLCSTIASAGGVGKIWLTQDLLLLLETNTFRRQQLSSGPVQPHSINKPIFLNLFLSEISINVRKKRELSATDFPTHLNPKSDN
jgi:hypothetical protein